jgi:hypothetical protein
MPPFAVVGNSRELLDTTLGDLDVVGDAEIDFGEPEDLVDAVRDDA